MKSLLNASLIVLATASAAQGASVQVETRAFHTNLRLDAKRAVYTVDDQEIGRENVRETFANTAGGGFSFIFNLDEYVDLGLGYSRARYFPGPEVTTDQQMISALSRWSLYRGTASRLYFLAGVTQHRLETEDRSEAAVEFLSTVSPVTNYDVGLGHVWSVGIANLGLEYKYSDTFGRGNSTAVMRTQTIGASNLVEREVKSRLKNFNIEQQELSLSLGINL